MKAVLLSFYLGVRIVYQDFHPIQVLDSNFALLCPERLSEVLLTPSASANAPGAKAVPNTRLTSL